MASTTGAMFTGPVSGLPINDGPRFHYDIYAILEAPQELYFGSEVAVNVNLVETVEVTAANDTVVEKCYISPTKRRGVERRTLIWAPRADGVLLGDALGCGIPGTCCAPSCPICSVYGGLITDAKAKTTYVEGGIQHVKDLTATTYVGRLTHGGGVAVQAQETATKQRAMHPSKMLKQGDDNPTPFRREYNQPALLYPVYDHCLSITDEQFEAVAYAFLNVLPRIGAGNPKGAGLADGDLLGSSQPLLVVDRYSVPLGRRPVVSPSITVRQQAIDYFVSQAVQAHGREIVKPEVTLDLDGNEHHAPKSVAGGDEHSESIAFTRRVGATALTWLEDCALAFTRRVLGAGPVPGRVA